MLAKVLAQFLFDDEKALTRIDMSEYMEKFSVSRLIGAPPPGYVGYDQGGQLTEVVRRRPYSVILFDEIEKAHPPDVFNVLLQLLDDGRLTDGQGRMVDFTNTVIIMTSNLGSQQLLGAETHEEGARLVGGEIIHQSFKPEFINRLDEIIIFERLGEAQIRKIVVLQLEQLRLRLEKRGFILTWEDDVLSLLYKEGYDPVFGGARPIRRAVQRFVENPPYPCNCFQVILALVRRFCLHSRVIRWLPVRVTRLHQVVVCIESVDVGDIRLIVNLDSLDRITL